jgi:hypothetical protein
MKLGSLTRTLALVGAASGALLGCTAHAELVGQAEVPPPPPPPQPAAEVEVEVPPPVVYTDPPVLVTIDPGVWVVRDSDYPVYQYNDEYWAYRDNVWYRSPSYDRGWVRSEVNVVPPTIAHRNHSEYVHFHGTAHAETRPAPRRDVPVRAAQPGRMETAQPGRVEAAHPGHAEAVQPGRVEDKRVETERNRGTQVPHEEVRSEPTRVEDKRVEAAHGAPQPAQRPDEHRGSREEAATARPAERKPEVVERRPVNAVAPVRPAPAPTRADRKRESEKH